LFYHIDPWKYFFRVHHPQDPKAELATSGGMVIHVKSEYGVDPYLEIPTPRSMEWRKKWFYLKNDDSTLLSAFTDGCPVPLAS
jgi:hypothetical protein